jgi:hypothetical protein
MRFNFLFQFKGLSLITFPNYSFFPNIFQINEEKEYKWIRTPFAVPLKYGHILWLAQE